MARKMQLPMRVYARVDLDAVCQNVQSVRRKVGPDVKIMAVVKTDAYGHGAVPVAKALSGLADAFAVATAEEAVELRRSGVGEPILVLGVVFEPDFPLLLDHDVAGTVFQYETAAALAACAKRRGKTAHVHLKVDTGMGRIGLQPDEAGLREACRIAALPALTLDGAFTHFACADMADKTSRNRQAAAFLRFLDALQKAGVEIPLRHMCNSADIIDADGGFLDMVRSGILTYGLYPSDEVDKAGFPLLPAMALKSHVAFVKTVDAGFPVSYGSTFVTNRRTVIATIPVGYGDGYPRQLSNRGRVLIRGQFAPILGRVCMDQFMVDATDIPGVQAGDEVTLIGKDGDGRIPVEEPAALSGRFNYEFCCDINKRVPRVYLKNGQVSEIADFLI